MSSQNAAQEERLKTMGMPSACDDGGSNAWPGMDTRAERRVAIVQAQMLTSGPSDCHDIESALLATTRSCTQPSPTFRMPAPRGPPMAQMQVASCPCGRPRYLPVGEYDDDSALYEVGGRWSTACVCGGDRRKELAYGSSILYPGMGDLTLKESESSHGWYEQ